MALTDKQFNRLSQAVQSEITGLKNELEKAREKLRVVFGEKPSYVKFGTYPDEDQPLPSDAPVHFQLRNDKEYASVVSVSLQDTRVQGVRELTVMGNDSIMVFPVSPNALAILLRPRDGIKGKEEE